MATDIEHEIARVFEETRMELGIGVSDWLVAEATAEKMGCEYALVMDALFSVRQEDIQR